MTDISDDPIRAIMKARGPRAMESFNPEKYIEKDHSDQKEHAMLWGAGDFKTIIKNNVYRQKG